MTWLLAVTRSVASFCTSTWNRYHFPVQKCLWNVAMRLLLVSPQAVLGRRLFQLLFALIICHDKTFERVISRLMASRFIFSCVLGASVVRHCRADTGCSVAQLIRFWSWRAFAGSFFIMLWTRHGACELEGAFFRATCAGLVGMISH